MKGGQLLGWRCLWVGVEVKDGLIIVLQGFGPNSHKTFNFLLDSAILDPGDLIAERAACCCNLAVAWLLLFFLFALMYSSRPPQRAHFFPTPGSWRRKPGSAARRRRRSERGNWTRPERTWKMPWQARTGYLVLTWARHILLFFFVERRSVFRGGFYKLKIVCFFDNMNILGVGGFVFIWDLTSNTELS